MKHHIPELPSHIISRDCYRIDGETVCYIWILSERGADIIGNQYVNARAIMDMKKCGRSTAYRMIERVTKRWWITDMRTPEAPRCYCALPISYVRQAKVLPVGNPNWRSGMYQQQLSRRRRR